MKKIIININDERCIPYDYEVLEEQIADVITAKKIDATIENSITGNTINTKGRESSLEQLNRINSEKRKKKLERGQRPILPANISNR